MAKRFGRNQRRQMRAKMTALKESSREAVRAISCEANLAQIELQNLKERAVIIDVDMLADSGPGDSVEMRVRALAHGREAINYGYRIDPRRISRTDVDDFINSVSRVIATEMTEYIRKNGWRISHRRFGR